MNAIFVMFRSSYLLNWNFGKSKDNIWINTPIPVPTHNRFNTHKQNINASAIREKTLFTSIPLLASTCFEV